MLPRFHWIRIKKDLDKVSCPSNWLQGLGFFLTSTAITIFLTLRQSGSSLPDIQKSGYFWCCCASLFLAIVIFIFDHKLREISTNNVDSIIDYIKDIDQMYSSPERITDTQRNESITIIEDEIGTANFMSSSKLRTLKGPSIRDWIYRKLINDDIWHWYMGCSDWPQIPIEYTERNFHQISVDSKFCTECARASV